MRSGLLTIILACASSLTAHAQTFSSGSTGADSPLMDGGATSCASAPAGLIGWWRAEGDANDFNRRNNGTPQRGKAIAAEKFGAYSLADEAFYTNGTLDGSDYTTRYYGGGSIDIGAFWQGCESTPFSSGRYDCDRRFNYGTFTLSSPAALNEVRVWIGGFNNWALPREPYLKMEIYMGNPASSATPGALIATSQETLVPHSYPTGTERTFAFASPVSLSEGMSYTIRLLLPSGVRGDLGAGGAYALFGSNPTCASPHILKQPRGATVLNNQSATLKVETDTASSPTFQWYKGDSGDTSQKIEGATSDSLTINSVAANSRTNYWVRVTNSCGTTNSTTTTVVAIDKLPLILVPGIAGSTLDVRGGREVWLGRLCVEQGLDALSLDPSKPSTDIVPSGIIGRVTVDYGLGVYRQEFYASFVERLSSNGYKSQDKTLSIFPYDWRRGADYNALRLKELVSQVQETYRDYPNIKVNIVAHSMGGLVARRYILDNPQNHFVEKLITIGTPWLGAPKAIDILETGNFIGVCNGSIKTLAEFFPGVHHLLPSSSYFQFGEKPFVEDGWDIDGDGKSRETYDYNNMVLMLGSRYRSSPGIAGLRFHNQTGQDDWSNDSSQVGYYHIVGLRYGADTIGQVIAKSEVKYCRLFGGIKAPCGFGNRYELKMVQGDGTVPYRSAYRRQGSINLNASRAKIIPILSSSDNKIENNGSDHIEMMSNERVFQAVMSSLSEQSTVTARQSIQPLDEPEEPTARSSYYVKLLGISSALISDAYGNTLDPFTGNTTEESPNITSYLLGEKGLLSVAPPNQTFTFTFTTNSNNELATLELTKGTDIETAQAVRYLDLNLPANTKVKLELTPEGIGALQYDGDGDGTFESTAQPTASVSGNAAQDTQAPTIGVNEVPLATTRRVTITATDESAGVKSVFYSLDGTNFQPYNGAFEINPTQTTTVYAFAEDNVANRSSLVTYSVKKRRKGRVRRGSRDGF